VTNQALIVEDLLELAEQGQQETVNTCIDMLEDFFQEGIHLRYCKPLKGLFWELKSRSRAGRKGGSRIYLFWIGAEYQEAAIIHAGYKPKKEACVSSLERLRVILCNRSSSESKPVSIRSATRLIASIKGSTS
jgi:hypothetical protein